MNELPEFFWADRLTPVNYYGYTSATREVFCEINANEEFPHIVNRFHDLKRKCMAMCVDVASDSDKEPVWSKDVWDNKIVIECKTETGATIYVGFYDFTYSIGLSMHSRDRSEPRPYRVVKTPSELAA